MYLSLGQHAHQSSLGSESDLNSSLTEKTGSLMSISITDI